VHLKRREISGFKNGLGRNRRKRFRAWLGRTAFAADWRRETGPLPSASRWPRPLPTERSGLSGGVEIEDDLLGRALVRLQEQIDKQRLDLGPVPGDVVIASAPTRPAPAG
jgi:hypothetical protein